MTDQNLKGFKLKSMLDMWKIIKIMGLTEEITEQEKKS